MKNIDNVKWLFSIIKENKLDLNVVICIELINGRSQAITTGYLLNLYSKANAKLQAKLRTDFTIETFFNKKKNNIINQLTVMFEKLICEGVMLKERDNLWQDPKN